MRFEYESRQQRVCFGSGQAAQTLARELERLDVSKVTVIAAGTASDLADRVTTSRLSALSCDCRHAAVGVSLTGSRTVLSPKSATRSSRPPRAST
jgi:hypothetical protein